jgi:methanogenic corrinoid protein MtbC1
LSVHSYNLKAQTFSVVQAMDKSSTQLSINRNELLSFVLPNQYAQCFDTSQVHPKFSQEMIRHLAADSLDFDPRAFHQLARTLLQESFDIESYMTQVVSGAAMVLGEWWACDRISISAVRLGANRLTELIYELADQRVKSTQKPFNPYKALISAPKDSQHTLGINVAAEIFHLHGWEVTSGPLLTLDMAPDMLAEEHFDLLGVTLSLDRDLLMGHKYISQCRKVSRNKDLVVVVGGTQAFLRPNLAKEVNADFAATNASHAQEYAMSLMTRIRTRTQFEQG